MYSDGEGRFLAHPPLEIDYDGLEEMLSMLGVGEDDDCDM